MTLVGVGAFPLRSGVLFLTVLLAVARPGGRLAAQDATLDRVAALTSDGRTVEARDTLGAWWDAGFGGASPETRQRALWLRGTLSVDPTRARSYYMRLIVEHPGGPYTASALLRIGQERAAEGRPADAARRFEQLLREYPNSPQRLDARRWLDEHRDAVSLSRTVTGAETAPDSDSSAGASGREPAGDSAVAERRVPPPSAGSGSDRASSGTEDSKRLPVSIQLGAFSTVERARTLMMAARNEGIRELRVVRIEGSRLVRVRAGQFAERAAATDLRDRILARGFQATVVEDGDRERPIQ